MKKNQIQLIRPDAPQNSPSLPLKKTHKILLPHFKMTGTTEKI